MSGSEEESKLKRVQPPSSFAQTDIEPPKLGVVGAPARRQSERDSRWSRISGSLFDYSTYDPGNRVIVETGLRAADPSPRACFLSRSDRNERSENAQVSNAQDDYQRLPPEAGNQSF